MPRQIPPPRLRSPRKRFTTRAVDDEEIDNNDMPEQHTARATQSQSKRSTKITSVKSKDNQQGCSTSLHEALQWTYNVRKFQAWTTREEARLQRQLSQMKRALYSLATFAIGLTCVAFYFRHISQPLVSLREDVYDKLCHTHICPGDLSFLEYKGHDHDACARVFNTDYTTFYMAGSNINTSTINVDTSSSAANDSHSDSEDLENDGPPDAFIRTIVSSYDMRQKRRMATIKKEYKRLRSKYHEDKVHLLGEISKEEARIVSQVLIACWELLEGVPKVGDVHGQKREESVVWGGVPGGGWEE